jgi:hypothetical protein
MCFSDDKNVFEVTNLELTALDDQIFVLPPDSIVFTAHSEWIKHFPINR